MKNELRHDAQPGESGGEGAGSDANPEPLVPVEPQSLSAEEIEELKQKASKADDHWDRLLRTTADFDNYRKRAAREKQEAIRFANESLMEKLVPILDSFEKALSASQNTGAEAVQSLEAGIKLVHQQLKTALQEGGLEEVDATGKTFDPNLHEAVSQRETAEAPEGQVIQQLRKGYKLKERLLRPASVIVAKEPAGKATK